MRALHDLAEQPGGPPTDSPLRARPWPTPTNQPTNPLNPTPNTHRHTHTHTHIQSITTTAARRAARDVPGPVSAPAPAPPPPGDGPARGRRLLRPPPPCQQRLVLVAPAAPGDAAVGKPGHALWAQGPAGTRRPGLGVRGDGLGWVAGGARVWSGAPACVRAEIDGWMDE
jgi:hypothetical protein